MTHATQKTARREGVPLNPALKKEHDRTYGADHTASDPMSTVSVEGTEGRQWPIIWAIVFVLGIAATVAFLFF